jgi:hypothetical protein
MLESGLVIDRGWTMGEPLCPSFNCIEGASLIGIIGPDGEVNYVNPSPTVDADFVERASQLRRPAEQRFRFAAPCVKSSCVHWTDARCGVVDLAISVAEQPNEDTAASSETLPKCSIRSKCRWFAQRGRSACGVCPSIFNYQPPESTA